MQKLGMDEGQEIEDKLEMLNLEEAMKAENQEQMELLVLLDVTAQEVIK